MNVRIEVPHAQPNDRLVVRMMRRPADGNVPHELVHEHAIVAGLESLSVQLLPGCYIVAEKLDEPDGAAAAGR